MIDKVVYTRQYIESQFEGNSIDYATLERVIYAFSLLEKLSNSNTEFVFKGGTCLALLTNKLTRFSVDIDIICNLEHYSDFDGDDDLLNELVNGTFKRFEPNRRKKGNIKKLHYKFFYDSVINDSENYVLLDVVFSDDFNITDYSYKDINLDFITTVSPFKAVRTPSISEMIADKSSAFAPTTIGIRYESNKNTEIIKQMYDIYVLLKEDYNIDDVISYYKAYVENHISNRELEIDYEDCVMDSIETLVVLLKKDRKDPNYLRLESGLKSFKAFTISGYGERELILTIANLLPLYLKYYFESVDKYSLKYNEFKNLDIKPNILDKNNRKRYSSILGKSLEEQLVTCLKMYHDIITIDSHEKIS